MLILYSNVLLLCISHLSEWPVKEFIKVFWRTWVLVLAPLLLSPIVLLSGEDQMTVEAMKCAYLILLMAVYWMTEALPLPITSMIPMVGCCL